MGEPFARGIQRQDHRPALVADGGFAHPFVPGRCLALDEAQFLELGHLAADGRVIAPGPVGEIDDADRAIAADPREQRKQRAIQRNPRFLDQPVIAARTVDLIDQIDDGGMQSPQNLLIVCIMHVYLASSRPGIYVHITH